MSSYNSRRLSYSGPRTRRQSWAGSAYSSSDSSDVECLLNVRVSRKQSLALAVTHCPLPFLEEELEEEEDVMESEEVREGGWGWVVVLSSFICLCVLDGVSDTWQTYGT